MGGAALEFYTAGGYATGDVDLALPSGADVDAAFAELGFRKEGRFWVHWRSAEDERWTRRLAHLYADRIDWSYLRGRIGDVPEEADALHDVERTARRQ